MSLFGPPDVAKLKAKGDVTGLIKALGYRKDQRSDDKVRAVRSDAAAALGEIGDARAVEPLIAALGDPSTRKAAVEALGKIGDARAVEFLIAALGDPDSEVGKLAVDALGQIGNARAVEPLIAALGDPATFVRDDAAVALGQIGDARAVEPLIVALTDPDASVRWVAAATLDKLAWSPDRGAAGAAYWAVKGEWDKCVEIGAPAVGPLIVALGDPDADTRGMAALTLGQIGAPAVEPLIVAVGDRNVRIRRAAVEALGTIGDARAVEPLIAALVADLAALKDKNENACRAAAKAHPAASLEAPGDTAARARLLGLPRERLIGEYLRHLATEWWADQPESRAGATCDACSSGFVVRGEGYLVGSSLWCENCYRSKNVEGLLKSNPDAAGYGALQKAQSWAQREASQPSAGKIQSSPIEKMKKLRDFTGAGLMDCKNALRDCGGDFDAAVVALKARGLVDVAKMNEANFLKVKVIDRSRLGLVDVAKMNEANWFTFGPTGTQAPSVAAGEEGSIGLLDGPFDRKPPAGSTGDQATDFAPAMAPFLTPGGFRYSKEKEEEKAKALAVVLSHGADGERFLVDFLIRDVTIRENSFDLAHYGDFAYGEWSNKRSIVEALGDATSPYVAEKLSTYLLCVSKEDLFASSLQPALAETLGRLHAFGDLERFVRSGQRVPAIQIAQDLLRLRTAGTLSQPMNVRDRDGYTPLHRAVREGDLSAATNILDSGADIDVVSNPRGDDLGETALYVAALGDEIEMVRLLLSRGANANIQAGSGYTSALQRASATGFMTVVSLLVESGADINIKTFSGRTPLAWAKQNDHEEVATYLRAHGGL